ncbi:hypothetical protein [Niallia circulans]|uniref:hypothetical protein n=1 Tax=Niallia circulans TaxID=1397 RepID=UPI00300AEB94
MERSIFPERYDLDGTTKKVLIKIIEKKKKYDKLKNRHLLIMWLLSLPHSVILFGYINT